MATSTVTNSERRSRGERRSNKRRGTSGSSGSGSGKRPRKQVTSHRLALITRSKVYIFFNFPTGIPMPKRPATKETCLLCPNNPHFQSGVDYDRHLIALHGYDYCKICKMIGVISTVRYGRPKSSRIESNDKPLRLFLSSDITSRICTPHGCATFAARPARSSPTGKVSSSISVRVTSSRRRILSTPVMIAISMTRSWPPHSPP